MQGSREQKHDQLQRRNRSKGTAWYAHNAPRAIAPQIREPNDMVIDVRCAPRQHMAKSSWKRLAQEKSVEARRGGHGSIGILNRHSSPYAKVPLVPCSAQKQRTEPHASAIQISHTKIGRSRCQPAARTHGHHPPHSSTHPNLDRPPQDIHPNLQARHLHQGSINFRPLVLKRGHPMWWDGDFPHLTTRDRTTGSSCRGLSRLAQRRKVWSEGRVQIHRSCACISARARSTSAG